MKTLRIRTTARVGRMSLLAPAVMPHQHMCEELVRTTGRKGRAPNATQATPTFRSGPTPPGPPSGTTSRTDRRPRPRSNIFQMMPRFGVVPELRVSGASCRGVPSPGEPSRIALAPVTSTLSTASDHWRCRPAPGRGRASRHQPGATTRSGGQRCEVIMDWWPRSFMSVYTLTSELARSVALNRPGSGGGSGYWMSTRGWSLRFVA